VRFPTVLPQWPLVNMPEYQWLWRCDRVIPSDTAAGRPILEELLAEMHARQWVEHDIFSVRLAAEEALVNAIIHGNRLDAEKQVRICCRIAPELVRIEVTDEGEGFNPANIPDPTNPERIEYPRGRGVMLMRTFMSRVEYSDSGKSVLMEKRRIR